MRIHACFLDKDCRRWGAPKRLHIFTKRWNIGIAFTPGDRFAHRPDKRSQWVSVSKKAKYKRKYR